MSRMKRRRQINAVSAAATALLLVTACAPAASPTPLASSSPAAIGPIDTSVGEIDHATGPTDVVLRFDNLPDQGVGVLPDLPDAGAVPWPWPGIAPAEFDGLADPGWVSAGRRIMSKDEAAVLGLSDNGGVVQRIYLLGPDDETIYSFSLWPMFPEETSPPPVESSTATVTPTPAPTSTYSDDEAYLLPSSGPMPEWHARPDESTFLRAPSPAWNAAQTLATWRASLRIASALTSTRRRPISSALPSTACFR